MGKAGSGKDTIADMLAERGFVRVAFADEIKRACMRWWGFTREQMFGPSERRAEMPPSGRGPTGRKAGQHVGTEVARALDEMLWSEVALEVAQFLTTPVPRILNVGFCYDPATGIEVVPGRIAPPRGVVIPDVRFKNEMRVIAEAGGMLVRVKRPGAGLKGEAARHPSELEQDSIPDSSFHAVIDNDGTLGELRTAVAALCAKWKL